MAVKFTYYPNSICQPAINDLIERIGKINTYGYIIKRYLEKEDFEVIFTDEDSIFKVDNKISNMTTRRGYAEDNKIVIHCTRYETIESIKWIFLHELGHRILKKYTSVMSLMYFIREKFYKDIGIFKSEQEYYSQAPNWYEEYHKDEVHENDPEEKIVSDFATNLIGNNYSRLWWRNNIDKINLLNEVL
jgi:hypothetical protein